MSVFNTALLWGGLGLVSIPIIIHLINRLRFRRLEWAAMEFLLEALRRTRRRIRIEELLLLLLRIALVLLIVLAVARPHLSQEQFGWLSGPFQSEEKVFVIDDSLSTGHVVAGRSALERAAESVVNALEKVHLDRPNDIVSIYRTSVPEPLAHPDRVGEDRLNELRDDLRGGGVFPTALRMDLAARLEEIADRGREGRGRAVYILTDLTAADWTDGQGGASEALGRALRRLAGPEETRVPITIVDVGAASRPNLAITAFSVETPNPVVGIEAELLIEVSHFHPGGAPARGIGLRLKTAGTDTPGPRIAELGAGETESLRVPHVFHDVGMSWITVELEGSPDGLAADDSRTLVAQVVEEVPILVVDGEPKPIFGEGETDYLVQALHPEGETRSEFAPAVVVEANVPRDELERYGAIVLANLGAVPADLASRLANFVRGGGALVIFPGHRVDAALWERTLGAGTPQERGVDLLPATLGEYGGDFNLPVHLEPLFDQPALEELAEGMEELFRLVEVGRFVKLAPHGDARVVGRLTDGERSPFLVERQVGRGRVVLFAVPADMQWTSWPRSPTYLPLLQELLKSIARPLGAGWTRLAGSRVEVPIDLARYQREATLRGPDYPTTQEQGVVAEPVAAGGESAGDTGSQRFQFIMRDTRKSGVYELTLRTVSGSEEARCVAVNSDPAESDLARLDPERLAALYPDVELTVIRDSGALLESDLGRFEIADGLLLLFVVVLLAEGTLAWWFAHHRRAAAPEAGPGERVLAAPARSAAGAGGGR